MVFVGKEHGTVPRFLDHLEMLYNIDNTKPDSYELARMYFPDAQELNRER